MLTASLMLRRLERILRYAVREEEFLPIRCACVTLLTIGTISYALREDWNVVDALYFPVATLTTSSIAAPDLVLENDWMKLFTVFHCCSASGSSLRSFVGWALYSCRSGHRTIRRRTRGEVAQRRDGDKTPTG
jgi:Ion channel